MLFGLQQMRTHHRRRHERDGHRDEDRHGHRDGEFTKQPAHDAAHQEQRNEHRHEREAHRQYGEADLLGPHERGLERRLALLAIARDVFDDDDGVVHDEAGGDRQGHERQVVEAVPQQVHHAERPDERQRHGDARDQRRPRAPQEGEDNQDDQADRHQERALDVPHRCTNGRRLIHHDLDGDALRDGGLHARQHGAHAVDRVDDVRARLAEDDHHDRRFAVDVSSRADVFDRIFSCADVTDAHRCAVVIGDDQRLVIDRVHQLVVGADLPSPAANRQLSLRRVRIRVGHGRAHLLEADPVLVQHRRVQLDADRRQRTTADDDLSDATDLRQGLRHDRRRRVVHLPLRQHGRGEREDHDGRVGGVDLAIVRIRGQVRRQIPAGRIDGRLDVARGRVDVPIQIELQGDVRGSQRARRGHLRHGRDPSKLPLERRGDRRRHRFRAGAWQRRRHRNRREVHLRQRRYRQQTERDAAGEGQRSHQQRGRDRPPNERR